jgi:hypothetical protein
LWAGKGKNYPHLHVDEERKTAVDKRIDSVDKV